jgi:uncharacterized membrane protein
VRQASERVSKAAVRVQSTLVGDANSMILVTLAAFLGTVADSLAGALTPRLGNETTNVLCTLTAALLTLSPA